MTSRALTSYICEKFYLTLKVLAQSFVCINHKGTQLEITTDHKTYSDEISSLK